MTTAEIVFLCVATGALMTLVSHLLRSWLVPKDVFTMAEELRKETPYRDAENASVKAQPQILIVDYALEKGRDTERYFCCPKCDRSWRDIYHPYCECDACEGTHFHFHCHMIRKHLLLGNDRYGCGFRWIMRAKPTPIELGPIPSKDES